MKTLKTLITLASLVLISCFTLNAADTLSIKQVDSPPAPIKRSAPVVPNGLSNIKGTIHIKMIITESGNVSDATVVKSTAEALNGSAIECVNSWTFKPAQKDGQNVAVAVVIPIRFK
jgi:TonB family protein